MDLESFSWELDKTFYLSLLDSFREIQEEITDFEIKEIIRKALSLVPELTAEWGNRETFGPTTLLLKKKDTILVIEASPLVYTLRILWNDFQRTQDSVKKIA